MHAVNVFRLVSVRTRITSRLSAGQFLGLLGREGDFAGGGAR
jgi:hypothetical protein